MIRRGRCAAVVGGGMAAVVLSAGSVAWACTYQDSDAYKSDSPMPSQARPQPAAQPQPQAEAQPQTQTQPQTQPQPQVQPAAQPAAQATAPSAAAAPAPIATRAAARSSRSTRTASVAPAAPTKARPAVAAVAPVEAAPAPVAKAPADDPLPSMSVVAGDLWSGFSSAPSTAANGSGLATPVPAAAESGSESMMIGMGLLSIGLVALGAGTAASLVRRSRVRVTDGSR